MQGTFLQSISPSSIVESIDVAMSRGAGLFCSPRRTEFFVCNSKGVTIVILQDEGKESGTRFGLEPSGITLKVN
jgi:hypothetical protein